MPTHKDLILQPQFNALIRAIYQASADPQAWAEALRLLADLVGAPFTYAVLQGDDGREVVLTYSADPADATPYLTHCEAARATQRAAQHLDPSPRASAPDRQAALPPPPWLPDASGTAIYSAPASDAAPCAVSVGVHLPEDPAPSRPSPDAVFSLLGDHLGGSLRMMQALSAKRASRARLAAVLDALPHGLIITDHHGVVIQANAAARALLAQGALRLDDQQRVRAAHPSDDATLLTTLAPPSAASADASDAATPRALRIPTPTGALDLLIAPLAAAPLPTSLALSHPTAFALLLHDPARDLALAPSAQLAARFGLTDAEHRVALALLRALPIKDVAASLHISQATARTHAQRVYQKVGVKDQAALLAALLRSVWTLLPSAHPTAEVFPR